MMRMLSSLLQMFQTRRKRSAELEAGFSLVELLVVLAIIAMTTAIVAPRVLGYLGSARTDSAKVQVKNLESALELYFPGFGPVSDTGRGLGGSFNPSSRQSCLERPLFEGCRRPEGSLGQSLPVPGSGR